MRWRDVVRKDLKDIGVKEDGWYEEATRSRAGWKAMYHAGLEGCRETQAAMATVASRDVVCEVCSRSFRRECDRKRHKCIAEKQKPVSEQRGAAQCLRCLSGSGVEGDWLCIDVNRGAWRVAEKLRQRWLQWQAGMWCVGCALGASGGRGTRRGTSV